MAMFIVQVSFGFQLPGLRRHKGFPISEGGGSGEIVSRNDIDNSKDEKWWYVW